MSDIEFLRRTGKAIEEKSGQSIEEMINFFLSKSPNNILSPNSTLYKIAVAKYNDKVSLTTRPPVPSWFCGYVDAETGFLIDRPDDSTLRANSGFVQNAISEGTFNASLTGEYGIDKCLELGLPGSFGYSNCIGLSGEEDIEVSGIDWEAQVATNYGEAGGAAAGQCGPGGTGGEITLSNAKITGNGSSNAFLTFDCTGRENWPNKTLGSGGTCINGELQINNKKVDWLRPGQNSKDLENIFSGYNGWVPPAHGSSVKVTVISVDGRYSASTDAKWP